MGFRTRALKPGETGPNYARACSRCGSPIVSPDGTAYFGEARFCSEECRAADKYAQKIFARLQQTAEFKKWKSNPRRTDFQDFLRGYLQAHPKAIALRAFLKEGR